MSYQQEKKVAIEAVLAATKLSKVISARSAPKAFNKHDLSPITLADWGVQAVCCSMLAEAFPADLVVGEEDAATLCEPSMATYLAQVTSYVKAVIPSATQENILTWIDRGKGEVSSRYWTLDPIDGTKGFLRGEQYAVAMSLVEEGQVKLGVLACPALSISSSQAKKEQGILFVAVRGQGSTMAYMSDSKPYPIHVGTQGNSSNSQIKLPYVESFESSHSDHFLQAKVARAVGILNPSLRMDSQVKYGMVASGLASLFIRIPTSRFPDYKENIWDHTAGSILVEEAGGCVTDMSGHPLNFSVGKKLVDNRGIIACDYTIHEKVISTIQEIGIMNS